MAKKNNDRPFIAFDGSERIRRYQTLYWFDGREKNPSRYANGFPRTEDGSIQGVGKLIMRGWLAKAQSFDWKEGKVLWTVKRGPKVPGTNIYEVRVFRGDPDA